MKQVLYASASGSFMSIHVFTRLDMAYAVSSWNVLMEYEYGSQERCKESHEISPMSQIFHVCIQIMMNWKLLDM